LFNLINSTTWNRIGNEKKDQVVPGLVHILGRSPESGLTKLGYIIVKHQFLLGGQSAAETVTDGELSITKENIAKIARETYDKYLKNLPREPRSLPIGQKPTAKDPMTIEINNWLSKLKQSSKSSNVPSFIPKDKQAPEERTINNGAEGLHRKRMQELIEEMTAQQRAAESSKTGSTPMAVPEYVVGRTENVAVPNYSPPVNPKAAEERTINVTEGSYIKRIQELKAKAEYSKTGSATVSGYVLTRRK
jgi:hypothetical protein